MENIIELKKISGIPDKEFASIVRQGAMLRIPYLEGKLAQANEKLNFYKQKYNIDLKSLKAKGLPEDSGYQMHEDFIEWEYWDDVARDTKRMVKSIKKLIEEIGEK